MLPTDITQEERIALILARIKRGKRDLSMQDIDAIREKAIDEKRRNYAPADSAEQHRQNQFAEKWGEY